MQIIRLSHTGYDNVTFWATDLHPAGCFININPNPTVYAVAAVTYNDGVVEVGLLEMGENVYRYIQTELQGKSLLDTSLVFVSNAREIFMVTQQGGRASLPPDIIVALDAVA